MADRIVRHVGRVTLHVNVTLGTCQVQDYEDGDRFMVNNRFLLGTAPGTLEAIADALREVAAEWREARRG